MTGGTAEPGAEAPVTGGPRPKEYDGEDVTVAFEPRRRPHAADRVRGLPEVFGLSRRPWVLPGAAAPEKVAEVIRHRPSSTLRCRPSKGGGAEGAPDDEAAGTAEPPVLRRAPPPRLLR
ncbi:(4Fe-4S)-binding protein [Streptomyces roseolus]|uniref:(4Fe-4S)-binding protein n=1 Tax=Streptomyces roseolus TaxID=67358 RepID=UPI0033CD6DB8